MNATSDFQVDINAVIRDQSELLAGVEAATDYFIDLHRNGPPLNQPTELKLSWNQSRAGSHVWVTFTEIDADGERRTAYQIPSAFMTEPVSRDISVLRLWRQVLRFRSDQNMKRLDELIRRMEQEERNGAVSD